LRKLPFAHLVKAITFGWYCQFLVVSADAQTSPIGSWNMINVRAEFSLNWSAFLEGQIRSLRYYDHFNYHEVKAGLVYRVNPQLRVTLAAGKYDTYREGGDFLLPKNNDEFRIWPQVLLTQSLGKFILEQRGRYEMRFAKNGYRNRFRYRLGLQYPFGKKTRGFQPFQIGISDELFLRTKSLISKETACSSL